MQSLSVRILTLVFFLGLPFAGLMYFWNDAHGKIERSATPVARQMTNDVLANWDKQLLDDLGTLQFRQSNAETEFERCQPKLGKFTRLENWKLLKSVAGSRDDMVWQFVSFAGVGQFEKGAADVKVTVARRTMNPEWRIESFELKPR